MSRFRKPSEVSLCLPQLRYFFAHLALTTYVKYVTAGCLTHQMYMFSRAITVEPLYQLMGCILNNLERWLGDIAPHLLPDEMKEGLAEAKRKAQQRAAIEAKIPKHLLYTRDWPTTIPTLDEAKLLSEVRLQIAQIMGLRIDYTDPHTIQGRYSELLDEKARRDGEKAKQIVAKGNKVRAA